MTHKKPQRIMRRDKKESGVIAPYWIRRGEAGSEGVCVRNLVNLKKNTLHFPTKNNCANVNMRIMSAQKSHLTGGRVFRIRFESESQRSKRKMARKKLDDEICE